MKKLIILDRDGVINRNPQPPARYILDVNDIVFNPDVISWISQASRKTELCVATNQQGVGKGLLTLPQLANIHTRINTEIISSGGKNLHFFVCTHLISENCNCRKPKPGLLNQALNYFGVCTEDSVFIGDSLTDYQAAKQVSMDYVDFPLFRREINNNPSFLLSAEI